MSESVVERLRKVESTADCLPGATLSVRCTDLRALLDAVGAAREFTEYEPLELNADSSDVCGYTCTVCSAYTTTAFETLEHDSGCVWLVAKSALAKLYSTGDSP